MRSELKTKTMATMTQIETETAIWVCGGWCNNSFNVFVSDFSLRPHKLAFTEP